MLWFSCCSPFAGHGGCVRDSGCGCECANYSACAVDCDCGSAGYGSCGRVSGCASCCG